MLSTAPPRHTLIESQTARAAAIVQGDITEEIHTVGPVWQGGDAHENELLADCYRSCFALAREYALRSLAFPSISTGAYRFPLDRACRIALAAIVQGLANNLDLDSVRVVCFDEQTRIHYEAALAEQRRGGG